MNFAFYVFGNPDGKYSQYPDDHTSELLKNQTKDLQGVRFSVCRSECLVHYVYQKKLSSESYIGFCLIFNKIQTLKYNELIHLFNWLCTTETIKKAVPVGKTYTIKSFSNSPHIYEDLEKTLKAQLSERFDNDLQALSHAFKLSDTKYTGKIGIDDNEIYNLTCKYKTVELNSANIVQPIPKPMNVKAIVLSILGVVLLSGLGFWIYEEHQEIDSQKIKIRNLESDNRKLTDSLSNSQSAKSNVISERDNLQKKYNDLQREYNDFKNNPKKLIENLIKEPCVIDPCIILNIEMRNKGEDYNQDIYSTNTTYINAKIYYYSTKSQTITLRIKFYKDNKLIHSTKSTGDYSYTDDFRITSRIYSSYEVKGFGNDDKGNWGAGDYRYEIWYGDKCLGVKHFKVY